MIKKLLIAGLALSMTPLTACVSLDPSHRKVFYRKEYEANNFTCDNPGECNALWSATLSWVKKSVSQKLRTQTDLLIETSGWEYGGTGTGVQVKRQPRGDGSYTVTIIATCGMRVETDCDRKPSAILIDFFDTIKSHRDDQSP